MSVLLRWAARKAVIVGSLRRCYVAVAEHSQLASEPAKSAAKAEQAKVPFSTLKGIIHDRTLKALINKPFTLENMTAVQAAVLPLLPQLAMPAEPNSTAPRDLLVKAKTGTGKTLGFLIPAMEARLNKLKAVGKQATEESDGNSARAAERAQRVYAKKYAGTLIISPTRELASQIAVEATRLASYHEGFEVRLFVGGSSKGLQMRDWRLGRRDIVVATPGRLRDFLDNEPGFADSFTQVQVLVLDEADTLLDMGFRDDIESIAEFLPEKKQRQSFLFSATVSPAIHQIAKKIMNSSHTYINTVGEETSPVHAHVPQYHTILSKPEDQLPHLLRLIAHDQLTNYRKSKVIVFLPTTKMTQLYTTLFRSVKQNALPAGRSTEIYEIHSKKAQESRTRTSDNFRNDTSGACVLVTSDVSARGVDYPNVTRVIQVGIPQTVEQYIHRVGRTGRRDLAGRGDLVLLPWEAGFITHQMSEIPIMPLSVENLTKEVEDLAAKLDQEGLPSSGRPKPRSSSRYGYDRHRRPEFIEIQTPVVPILARIEPSVKSILEELDIAAVDEVFSSILGYYFGKTSELRCGKDVILEGCREFTTGALGLSEPPYVSAAFLEKIGFSEGRQRRRKETSRNSRSLAIGWGERGRSRSPPRFGLKDSTDESDSMSERYPRRFDSSNARSSRSSSSEDRLKRFDSDSSNVPQFRVSRLREGHQRDPHRSRGSSRQRSF